MPDSPKEDAQAATGRPAPTAATRPDAIGPAVFFDGVCGVCNRFVDFVLSRDKDGVFRLAPLQGETARRWIDAGPGSDAPDRDRHAEAPESRDRQPQRPSHCGLSERDVESLASIVLVDAAGTHRHSTAVVRVLWGLGGPWKVLGTVLWLVPRPLRDLGYRLVARHRYRLFGRKPTCRMPTPEERARLLP